MITLTQIGYALAVDEHRHFQRAAAASYVSQPTLSMQLQKLEDEIGVVLFDRSRKPVEPTHDGQRLIDQFRHLMREYERIGEIAGELQGVVAGRYRLGVIPTMAPYVLPRVIPRFTKQHPAVSLEVEELTTDQIIERLVEGKIDGGVLATPLHDQRLKEFVLFREDFRLFHSPELSVPVDSKGRARLGKLPMERLLVMREGHCLRTQTLDLCSLGELATRTQGFMLAAGSLTTLGKMVLEGPYFTVLPALAAEDLASQGHGRLVKELAGRVPFREVSLVVHRTQTRRAIRDALLGDARELLAPLETRERMFQSSPVEPR